jgi:hypothetical protein
MEEINPLDVQIDTLTTKSIARQLGKIEGIDDYFRNIMGLDLQRHFATTDEKSQEQIRGHYNFAMYLLKNIIEARSLPKAK